MKIYIILENYRIEERNHDPAYFKAFVRSCQALGIDGSWAESHLKEWNQRFAVIDIPRVELTPTSLDKININTYEQLMIGYMFMSHFPNKRHLTLKTFMMHFDALVIDQNQILLNTLYRMEYDWYEENVVYDFRKH